MHGDVAIAPQDLGRVRDALFPVCVRCISFNFFAFNLGSCSCQNIEGSASLGIVKQQIGPESKDQLPHDARIRISSLGVDKVHCLI